MCDMDLQVKNSVIVDIWPLHAKCFISCALTYYILYEVRQVGPCIASISDLGMHLMVAKKPLRHFVPSCKIRTSKCHIPSKECRYSNYSLPDVLGDSDGNETRDKPACSTEESTMEEGSSGGFNVALGQHSTAGRYGRNKSTSAFSTQSYLQLV